MAINLPTVPTPGRSEFATPPARSGSVAEVLKEPFSIALSPVLAALGCAWQWRRQAALKAEVRRKARAEDVAQRDP